MSEQLYTKQETSEVIDRNLANKFNKLPDDFLFDREFTIKSPEGQSKVSIEDFGPKYVIGADGKRTGEKYPIVEFKDDSGTLREVPTEEFLSMTTLSPDEIASFISENTPEPNETENLYETSEEEKNVGSKADLYPRHKLLFAPVKAETEPEPEIDVNYDAWFDKDNEVFDPSIDPQTQIELAANRPPDNERLRVTPESQKIAEERLEIAGKSDSNLRLIFEKYSHKGTSLSELLRIDEGFRTDVGIYLLSKLDKLANNEKTMGQQIKDNSEKNPGTTGYSHIPELRSREYATLLAMSMLDGTFKDGLVKADTIEHANDGEVLLGQHRAAAKKIINLS